MRSIWQIQCESWQCMRQDCVTGLWGDIQNGNRNQSKSNRSTRVKTISPKPQCSRCHWNFGRFFLKWKEYSEHFGPQNGSDNSDLSIICQSSVRLLIRGSDPPFSFISAHLLPHYFSGHKIQHQHSRSKRFVHMIQQSSHESTTESALQIWCFRNVSTYILISYDYAHVKMRHFPKAYTIRRTIWNLKHTAPLCL